METKKLERRAIEETKGAKLETTGKAIETKRQKSMWKKKNTIRLSWWQRRKLKKAPQHSFIITMFFRNGTSKTWVLKCKDSTFNVGKKHYFLYYEESFFDLSMNQYHLYYAEGYPIPINREIVVDKDNTFFRVSPESLKDLIKMKYFDAIVRASELEKRQKALIIGIIVLGVIVAFIFFGGGA